jgi:NAD(P)H-dependent flavin oxidoreductase YrpB (nitropropane dioxygenase family)
MALTPAPTQGILPAAADKERIDKNDEEVDFKTQMDMIPLLMGQAAGAIDSVLPAQDIIDEMMSSACEILQGLQQQVARPATGPSIQCRHLVSSSLY